MQNLQEVFNRLQKAKSRQREIRNMYKDALTATPGYQDAVDELKRLREKKKSIETATKESMSTEITELEDLKVDIESDNELLSDIALTQLIKGEQVEVSDAEQNQYEPIFKVSFRKMK